MTAYSKADQLKQAKRPKRGKRGEFSREDYEEAIKRHSKYGGCFACGMNDVELHHVVYKSRGGRGVWRNAVPLCQDHHRQAHASPSFNGSLMDFLEEHYGEHYYKDEWDLYDEGLIGDPTKAAYNEYWRNHS